MNKKIERYIHDNRVCNACIFRNWDEFLHLLFENNGRVEMIIWYDYCKICAQDKSLGCGGYIDLQNTDYMWAETQLFETELQEKSLEDIQNYISTICGQYSDYNLYPEFYIL